MCFETPVCCELVVASEHCHFCTSSKSLQQQSVLMFFVVTEGVCQQLVQLKVALVNCRGLSACVQFVLCTKLSVQDVLCNVQVHVGYFCNHQSLGLTF